jgi:Zn-dependent peptidase ImmA (M78 family)
MWARTVGNRKYSDPDVASIIDRSGGLTDPYEVVRNCVDSLLNQLNKFETSFENAFERICILASIAGFEVKPFQGDRSKLQRHEAVFVPSPKGHTKGTIFYNPDLPLSRIIFSIGHEISHSFFPASKSGARFRSLSSESSKGARELEMLCHAGASELTMPTAAFRSAVERYGFGFNAIDLLRKEFGTSFEACTYRMAQTAAFPAAGGLFQFKLRVGEAERVDPRNPSLFSKFPESLDMPVKKYRRQSFHYSEFFPRELVIPWNKSVAETSHIYRAAESGTLQRGLEKIPINGRGKQIQGHLEAMPAPFQSEDCDSDHPDILFLLTLNSA